MPDAFGLLGMQGSRADYEAEDVEYYFNYMGCLADEGTYDRMEAMLQAGRPPCLSWLVLAAVPMPTPTPA